MKPVPDEFLLTAAGIAATLVGLLLLGGFFYLETGFRRATTVATEGGPFLRATTRFTLSLYSMVLGLSLGLVVLRQGWLIALYLGLALAILASFVEWARRYRELRRVLPISRASPWITALVITVMLVWPWIVDGWNPGREAMTASVLVAGALALMSTTNLLLQSFDLTNLEDLVRRVPPTRGDPESSSDLAD